MDMDDYIGSIIESQTPSHPTWPCLFPVVSIVAHNSPQEIRNPNFKNVPNSDVLIYLFLILWHISGNFSYYYAGVMLDAHKSLYYAQNYASIMWTTLLTGKLIFTPSVNKTVEIWARDQFIMFQWNPQRTNSWYCVTWVKNVYWNFADKLQLYMYVNFLKTNPVSWLQD